MILQLVLVKLVPLLLEAVIVDYTSKSINQLYGCINVGAGITAGTRIRSNETVFGYEGGDTSKRVDLRITGVLADFKPLGKLLFLSRVKKSK